jgi:hypothetical protein
LKFIFDRYTLLDGPGGDKEPTLRKGCRHLVNGHSLLRNVGRKHTFYKLLLKTVSRDFLYPLLLLEGPPSHCEK